VEKVSRRQPLEKIPRGNHPVGRLGSAGRLVSRITSGVRVSASSNCCFNPLDSKGKYSVTSNNTKLVTLAVDGWAVTFGIVRRGLGGLWPRPVPFLAVPKYVTAQPSTAMYQSLYCYMMVRCSAVLMWRLKCYECWYSPRALAYLRGFFSEG